MDDLDKMIDERLAICSACAIFKPQNKICDASKFVSSDGSDWSYAAKPGYTRGCGCMISWKVKIPGKHCPAGLW